MDENPVLKLPSFRVSESNVFLMTRFRNTSYHQAISDAVADGVRAFGLEFVRADDPQIAENILWRKVQFCIEACHFGVAVFEDIDEAEFNPNVSLELGYMLALNRECLLLKEQRLKKLPTDLCGHLYKEFDSYNIRPTVLGRIADWFKSNGVRKRDGQKLIVFVSYGGTDRCAIAKVIANHLLMQDNCTLDFRVESRAAFNPSASTEAKTGIEVAQGKLGQELLGSHRPQHAGPAFLFEADVILATDGAVLSKLMDAFKYYPGSEADQRLVREEIKRKAHLLSEFFGGSGDIEDPYPDRRDPESTRKYEKCFDDLHHLISNGLPRLTELLERASPPTVQTVSFGDGRLLGTT